MSADGYGEKSPQGPSRFFVVWREQKLKGRVRYSARLVKGRASGKLQFVAEIGSWEVYPDKAVDPRLWFELRARDVLDRYNIQGVERIRVEETTEQHLTEASVQHFGEAWVQRFEGRAFEDPDGAALPEIISPSAVSTKKWISLADAFAVIKQSVALPLDPLPFSEHFLTEAAAAKCFRMRGRERRWVNGEAVLGKERKIKSSYFTKPHYFTDTGINRSLGDASAEMILADRADQYRGGSGPEYVDVLVHREGLERALEGDCAHAEGDPPNAVTRQEAVEPSAAIGEALGPPLSEESQSGRHRVYPLSVDILTLFRKNRPDWTPQDFGAELFSRLGKEGFTKIKVFKSGKRTDALTTEVRSDFDRARAEVFGPDPVRTVPDRRLE